MTPGLLYDNLVKGYGGYSTLVLWSGRFPRSELIESQLRQSQYDRQEIRSTNFHGCDPAARYKGPNFQE